MTNSKYRIADEFKDWTLDELQVAITTLEHDLRGSWAGNYNGRLERLEEICTAMVHAFERTDKQTFVAKLQSGLDYADMANYDIVVASQEYDRVMQDGRVFRDCAAFYNVELAEAGKTGRVISWLTITVDCDDWHWFQRND